MEHQLYLMKEMAHGCTCRSDYFLPSTKNQKIARVFSCHSHAIVVLRLVPAMWHTRDAVVQMVKESSTAKGRRSPAG